MSVNLIYHTSDSIAGGVSPFDTAIMHMVKGQDICIACPYLSLNYLKQMTEPATQWRLLTDLEEWLSSQSVELRKQIIGFIAHYRESIRHCKDLHAKVLVAGKAALTGSANFTNKGITGRVEMSTQFEDCDKVQELRDWFETLWQQSALPETIDISKFAESVPEPKLNAGIVKLPSQFMGVHSKMSAVSEKVLIGSKSLKVRLLLESKSPEIQQLVGKIIAILETDGVNPDTTGSDGGDIRHWLNDKLFSEMELRKQFVRLVLTVPKRSITDPDFEWNTSGRSDRGKVRIYIDQPIPEKIKEWIEAAKRYTSMNREY